MRSLPTLVVEPEPVTGPVEPGPESCEPVRIDAAERSDADLVAAVARRDEAALAEVHRRHAGPAFGLARRVLIDRSLAEEIVQEVFLRLWSSPEKFDAARGSLRSYLLAQTHGRSVDLLRSETARRRREERDARRTPVEHPTTEGSIVETSRAEAVRAALATLADPERRAIELAYFGGHSYREVATLLDQPEGTVKSRIRSGMQRLRVALSEAGVTT